MGNDEFDVDFIADRYAAIPGSGIDMANKLMKPVTNYATTYRRLFQSILDGKYSRESYQAMAKWVSDNPPFASRAYREWITWMYKENRLVDGRLRLRGERVDLTRIKQNLLVVTAERTTSPRQKAPSDCSTWSRARTSRIWTAQAVTSG